jgi:tRNA dimethylallyltransferase
LLLIVAGPTASGKTALAVQAAQYFDADIISFDSRQFYREMCIGTAVPSLKERSSVRHHCILSHSVRRPLDAASFAALARRKAECLFENSRVVVAVGGTGLYLKAWLEGLDAMPSVPEAIRQSLNQERRQNMAALVEELQAKDPIYAAEADLSNPARVCRALEVIRASGRPYSSFRRQAAQATPYPYLVVAPNVPRGRLYERIEWRTEQMMRAGLLDEVRRLWPLRHLRPLQTVGYQELFHYLEGNAGLSEAVDKIKQHTRNYAKRQGTWFRRMPGLRWLPADNPGAALFDELLRHLPSPFKR